MTGEPDALDGEPPLVVKKLMYVNRRAPHGSIYAQEGLEVVLTGAAFDQDVSVLFMDDGVFQIVRGQDTTGIEAKDFSPTYRALEMYDVRHVYVEESSLAARGLGPDDLVIPVEVLDSQALGRVMDEQDVVLTF